VMIYSSGSVAGKQFSQPVDPPLTADRSPKAPVQTHGHGHG
jgi:hypothetical protein